MCPAGHRSIKEAAAAELGLASNLRGLDHQARCWSA